jgi:hypothetical protein
MKRNLSTSGARRYSRVHAAIAVSVLGLLAGTTMPASAGMARDLPKFETVAKDLTEVVSITEGKPLWDLHKDDKTGKLLAVLPSNYEGMLHMIACTVSGGDAQAGVMGPTFYVEPRRVNDTIMFVQPNLSVRTSGDAQAKASMDELYTGRVLLTAPIIAMQGSRPVIDLGAIATRNARDIFGSSVFGGFGPSVRGINPSLAKLTKAKAFPENILVEYEAPNASGTLVRLSYSIGGLNGTPGFKPRAADPRVGYFYDWHRDFAKPSNEDVTERYISRWHLEKADPNLRLSPPKEPIVWYIEHTTPIRYRQYVRQGIEMWNDAYEQIGIVGALEVRQQDQASGAYMDIDPEDARFNFFRWNSSDQSYAIGPSRTNPKTGEILDADVVWHQGLTRGVRSGFENLANDIAEQAFGPESLAWFEENPDWDPRVRLAKVGMGTPPVPGASKVGGHDFGDHEERWAIGMPMHSGATCRIGEMLSFDFALADIAMVAGLMEGADPKESEEILDGLPEDFVGGMIRYISAHEVGHCLGLQHNMAASTIRTLEEINSEGFEGPTVGSVMEYAAVNINHELGEVQGPYATPELGPYDMWAIAYGYGDEKDMKDVLARVAEPDLIWLSQSAMGFTQDPRNVTWDLGADNLNFAESRMSLVQELRGKLVDEIVDDGESWATARQRYQALMGPHLQSLSIAAGWVGGTFISNDFKGDPNGRMPVEDVPVSQQRRALNFIIDNSFNDDALGLTPNIVRALGKEHWWDPSGVSQLTQDGSFTVHDLVSGVHATSLSLLMSPTRLRRVYDNEFRVDDSDKFTLAELLTGVTDAAWSEVESGSNEISSFRRNLQTEHLNRLVTLALLDRTTSPAVHTISTLAVAELERIDGWAEGAQRRARDAYTKAHLSDVRKTIEQAMNVAYTIDR